MVFSQNCVLLYIFMNNYLWIFFVVFLGLLVMVEEFKREIREFKINSVLKVVYNELKVENDKFRQDFEFFKTFCGRKIRDLVNEVDEEKKIRFSIEVEMKRIKKMVNDEFYV